MEPMRLIGNTAVVTGGNKGIGFGIADGFMAHGASVAICGRDEKAGLEAEKKLNDKYAADGVRAVFIKCDVSDAKQVKEMIAEAIKELGSVHIFCNNAGVNPPYTRTWDQEEATWDKVINVDLKGPFLCMREIIPYWIEQKIQGAIINITSINYCCATDGMVHYCAAKAGLVNMTKVVAGEAGRYGIRANCIAPGLVITEMSKNFAVGKVKEAFKSRSPLYLYDEDKLVGIEDCAMMAIFLASNYSSWVTGETFLVDGGNHIRGLHSYYDMAMEVGCNN